MFSLRNTGLAWDICHNEQPIAQCHQLVHAQLILHALKDREELRESIRLQAHENKRLKDDLLAAADRIAHQSDQLSQNAEKLKYMVEPGDPFPYPQG